MMQSQFFICLDEFPEPISWSPEHTDAKILALRPDCTYFGKVFTELNKILSQICPEDDGLVFYLTWNLNTLPSYGSNVVAVVLGDEWCRIPFYSHKVLAVFKTYGTKLELGFNFFIAPSFLNLISLLQYLRVSILRFPSILFWIFQKIIFGLKGLNKNQEIYSIPLGYYRQDEMPIQPIEMRQSDVYFCGSLSQVIVPFWSPKFWLKSPKNISRNKMFSILNTQLKDKYNINLDTTPSFLHSVVDNKNSYSENMMNTKICLVPRGTSYETYRFFEGMRYGCIVITEYLPSHWFYNNSPSIVLKNWDQLGEALESILTNKTLLHKKHQESLEWWSTKCSEKTLANWMSEKIIGLLS